MNFRRLPSYCTILLLVFSFHCIAGASNEGKKQRFFDITEFGALSKSEQNSTAAIQRAIDACSQAGGGTVYFPPGRFLSGTLFLKSHVTLYLENGATLLGSKDLNDYPVTISEYRSYTDNYTDKSLIYAEKAEHIGIIGHGTIDGQGASFKGPYKVRPYMLRIIECKNIIVKDITILNSPMWVQHYLACDNVNIDGITVNSVVNSNNDGIDIDSCHRVRISNCDIISGDDAIVLKSTSDRVCKDVSVSNCTLSSRCNAFKLGTESNGGFQNITMNNCTIYDTRLSGIALELVDGGTFDRVSISNITMNNVDGGIFVRLGNRARPFTAEGPGGSRGTFKMKPGTVKPGMGSMSNIFISNIQATGVGMTGCSITGLPGYPVENITLNNIRIAYKGGGTTEHTETAVPERPDAYPEYKMFGILPAYGFFVRHAQNVRFDRIDLTFEETDQRPAFIFEDIRDLKMSDMRATCSTETPVLLHLKQIDGASIQNCRPTDQVSTFMRISGERSSGITLSNNDMRLVETILSRDDEVRAETVHLVNNRTK